MSKSKSKADPLRVDTLARQRSIEGLRKARESSLASRRDPTYQITAKRALRGPKKLRSKHFDIARRLVLGQTVKEISRDIGLNYDYVRIITQTPVFETYLKDLQAKTESQFVKQVDTLHQKISDEQVSSVEKLVSLRDSADKDETQLRAAMSLLAAGGNDRPTGDESSRDYRPVTNDIATAIAVAIKDVQIYVQEKANGKKDA